MRIGVISYDYVPPIGGLGAVVSRLTGRLLLSAEPHEYVIISPSPGAPENVSLVARLWWNRRGGCPVFSVVLSATLNTLIRRHKLDAVHIHSGSGGVVLLRRPSCPVIATAHHTYQQELDTVYANARVVRRAWKSLMATLEKSTYGFAQKIVCVSHDTKIALATLYGVPAYKMEVIENSIDLVHFQPDSGVVKDGNTVAFLGRLEDRKGIWILLRAFAKLRRKYPMLKLRLIGDDLTGNRLQSFIRQSDLGDSVTCLGRVHDPLFLKEMRSATVIVVPSLVEGFGLIAAECMAAGTCVVASDCEGLRSIVEHGKTGFLFKNGDSESCFRVLEEALMQPDRRKMIERDALLHARNRFDVERQAREMEGVYEKFEVR